MKFRIYDPKQKQNYQYQILCRGKGDNTEWEHCDYAKSESERDYLLGEYKMVLEGYEFKVIQLPKNF